MRSLRQQLEAARRQSGLGWEIVERDFALSWVLIGLAQVESLRDRLVLKGGGCLKKCYFGSYRFSEDLDFTAVEAPTGAKLERSLQLACERMVETFAERGPMGFVLERHEERQPHPRDQECFVVRLGLPWHRPERASTWPKVKLEISYDEALLWSVARRPLLATYQEPDLELAAYTLEEVVAEKLRAILQSQAMLEQRGWVRARSRDYYDLWRIFQAFGSQLDLSDFLPRFSSKCKLRDVTAPEPSAFFQEPLLGEVFRQWDSWLGPLLREPPEARTVIQDLQEVLNELWHQNLSP